MPSSVLTLGLMATAAIAQDLTGGTTSRNECTVDTAKDDCQKITTAGGLIKPTCIGNWRCDQGSCAFKCDGVVVTDPTPCPDGSAVTDKYKQCVNKGDTWMFERATCECSEKEVKLCKDGTELRAAVEECFKDGGKIQDAETCECILPDPNDPDTNPAVCPQDVLDGCSKEGGQLSSYPDCSCKRDLYCPAPFETVLKASMAEKCKGGGLMLNPKNCECVQPPTDPVDPVDPVDAECTYTVNGDKLTAPVRKARYDCMSRENHVFGYNSGTGMCSCVREALDTDAVCPKQDGEFESVSVEYAEKLCGQKGLFAYPRTSDFDARSCECKPVPVDHQEPVDCSAFRTCDKANPCLTREAKCMPFDQLTKQCPDGTKPCGRFGEGGALDSVCPDGNSYEKSKMKCLANKPSIWHPLRCKCELIVPTDKCPEEVKRNCLEREGHFVPEKCACVKPEEATCNDAVAADYSQLKSECASDALKFFVEEPHCKCITKEERPSTEGCDQFSSVREAMRLCPGHVAQPATQYFDKASCQCRDIVQTRPLEPRMPYKQDMKMIICQDGLTAENIKEAIPKVMAILKVKISLKYPDATIVFHSVMPITKPDGTVCVGVKFTVLHPRKERLTALLVEAADEFTANRDYEDSIKFGLRTESKAETESKPVSLAFEAEGAISGGDAAVPSDESPTPNDITGSAAAAAPAVVSLLASVLALFA